MKTRRIRIKTEAQIEGIRRASQLTKRTLDLVGERIQPGVTTETIDRWVHECICDHGGTPATLGYRGYTKSCCTSINDVILHGIPDDTVVKEGDIINVDVTSILDGYFGDASRMYCVGSPPKDAVKLVDVTRECMELGIEQVKPGNTVGHIGFAIQRHAEKHGYSVVRDFVGHGIGIEFHEPPDIVHYGRKGHGPVLRTNMTFTVEPMINAGGYGYKVLKDGWTVITKDGALSAQWEHTVRVTDSGVEILTA